MEGKRYRGATGEILTQRMHAFLAAPDCLLAVWMPNGSFDHLAERPAPEIMYHADRTCDAVESLWLPVLLILGGESEAELLLWEGVQHRHG